MRIKLVGALPEKLKDLGLKPGDMVEAFSVDGAPFELLRFRVFIGGEEQFASVDKHNYVKI